MIRFTIYQMLEEKRKKAVTHTEVATNDSMLDFKSNVEEEK